MQAENSFTLIVLLQHASHAKHVDPMVTCALRLKNASKNSAVVEVALFLTDAL